MNFDSYIISDTKTAITVLPKCPPPPYPHKGFSKLDFKKKAFTLAEVLITLTIIGVVAAMTIPTLMSKYQKHTYVVGLKKAYSQLQNAWKMVPLTEGCPAGDYACTGFPTTSELVLLEKQFKLAKSINDCKFKPDSYIFKCFQTHDGTIVFSNSNSTFGVDINGEKGPDKSGRDIFFFEISSKYTLEPRGKEFVDSCTTETVNNAQWLREHGCTAKVLFEDAMNY